MFDKVSEIYESRLQAMANTRLLFNSMAKLEEFLGNHAIHSNGIKRCFSSTSKLRAAYRDCKVEVEVRTNGLFDLDWLIINYKRAWLFYKNRFLRRKNPDAIARNILESYFDYLADKKVAPKNLQLVKAIIKEDVNLALLTLLLLKAIPGYDSKMGDVVDIDSKFNDTLHFLKDFTNGCGIFEVLPVITMAEEETDLNRLKLIYHTVVILDTYENYLNPTNITQTAAALKESSAYLDLDGIWKDDESTDFWQFEDTDNPGVFFASRYAYEGRSLLTLVRYTLYFLKRDDGRLTVYFLHPVAIRHRIAGKPYGDEDNAWYIADYPESDAPDSLSLIRTMKSQCWPYSINLHRVTDPLQLERYDYHLSAFTKIDPYEKCRYTFRASIYAITQEAVYVLDEKEQCYYRLPRFTEHEFEMLTLDDNVGILEMAGTRYLAIDERLLFIPLAPRSLRPFGIERVAAIE